MSSHAFGQFRHAADAPPCVHRRIREVLPGRVKPIRLMLAVEGRQGAANLRDAKSKFQSTPLRERRPFGELPKQLVNHVSIHTPARGATCPAHS